MKLWVCIENNRIDEQYQAEHGLSLYLEANNHRILFDMGQTDSFFKNAEKMGIDLSLVDIAVLSHGHYDHGGGLEKFLKQNQKAQVYISALAFGDYYHGEDKYIGLNPDLKDHPRLTFVSQSMKLDEGIKLYAGQEGPLKYPINSFGLSVKKEGVHVWDDFSHEQYLEIEENGKRIVISGCSHRGILNIMDWLKPDVLIGGFHFAKLDPHGEGRESLIFAADELSRYDTIYYTGHCTGEAQFAFLKERMKDQLNSIHTGCCIEIK